MDGSKIPPRPKGLITRYAFDPVKTWFDKLFKEEAPYIIKKSKINNTDHIIKKSKINNKNKI
tara:strand:+ start:1611 stop:1796 length:186 start_codon:yes stop_codon:yes gene_type:complete